MLTELECITHVASNLHLLLLVMVYTAAILNATRVQLPTIIIPIVIFESPCLLSREQQQIANNKLKSYL